MQNWLVDFRMKLETTKIKSQHISEFISSHLLLSILLKTSHNSSHLISCFPFCPKHMPFRFLSTLISITRNYTETQSWKWNRESELFKLTKKKRRENISQHLLGFVFIIVQNVHFTDKSNAKNIWRTQRSTIVLVLIG